MKAGHFLRNHLLLSEEQQRKAEPDYIIKDHNRLESKFKIQSIDQFTCVVKLKNTNYHCTYEPEGRHKLIFFEP